MDARRCSWAALPLRLGLGFGMIYHGYPKLFSAEGHEMFVGMLGGMGMPAPEALAWAVGGLELVGGLMILVGALTRVLSAVFVVEMLVALFLVHLPHGFNVMNITGMTEQGPTFGMPGYEFNVLYIIGFLALLLGGAGHWSVDALWGERKDTAAAGRTPPTRTAFPRRAPTWRKRSRRPGTTAE